MRFIKLFFTVAILLLLIGCYANSVADEQEPHTVIELKKVSAATGDMEYYFIHEPPNEWHPPDSGEERADDDEESAAAEPEPIPVEPPRTEEVTQIEISNRITSPLQIVPGQIHEVYKNKGELDVLELTLVMPRIISDGKRALDMINQNIDAVFEQLRDELISKHLPVAEDQVSEEPILFTIGLDYAVTYNDNGYLCLLLTTLIHTDAPPAVEDEEAPDKAPALGADTVAEPAAEAPDDTDIPETTVDDAKVAAKETDVPVVEAEPEDA